MEYRNMYIRNRMVPVIDGKPLKSTLLAYIRRNDDMRGHFIAGGDRYIANLKKAIKERGAKKSDFFELSGYLVYRYDPAVFMIFEGIDIKSDAGNAETVSRVLLDRIGYWEDYHGNWHSNETERGYLDGYGYYPLDELRSGDYFEAEERFYESADHAYDNDSSLFLSAYHSGSVRILEPDADLWIGFEIEKEDRHVLLSRTIKQFKRNFPKWRLERDGSLNSSNGGFECISPVFAMDTDADYKKMMNEAGKLWEYVNADYSSSRCGFHVSVSYKQHRRNDSQWRLYNELINWMPLLYALYPSRADGDNCEYSQAKYKDSNSSGRDAISEGSNRIELRIFPALRDMNQLQFRLDLVLYMLKNKISDTGYIADHFKRSEFKELLNRVYFNDDAKFANLIRRTWTYAVKYQFIEHNDLDGSGTMDLNFDQ